MKIANPRLRQDLQSTLETIRDNSSELTKLRLSILKGSLFKKFLGTPKDENVKHSQALDRFRATNERIRLFNQTFAEDIVVKLMREEMSLVFQTEDTLTLNVCANLGKCGPGASNGHKGDVDFFTKMFDSRLTHCNDALLRHYKHIISDRWLSAELVRDQRHSTFYVEGSKITTVPKDESKRRTICTEPILNMFYQLGAKTWLERALRRHHNIDVSNQQIHNRRLASEGSVTGKIATIDLSDASDSISVSLVRAILPYHVLSVLDMIRAHRARVGQEWVELHMYSTMGNGFTFVLMTLIFSCLIRAVYRLRGLHPKANVNYAVFGDDILVDNDVYPDIIHALTSLGFIPNKDKSFSEGFFRESCGGDYFHGFNVRGVYCKRLNHEADLYSLFNRLLRWSIHTGIDISPVLVRIVSEFRGRKLLLVPPDIADTGGIKVPARIVGKPSGVGCYEYLQPVPRRFSSNRRKQRNVDGAITAFIGGALGETVTQRSEITEYKVTRGYTPVWDRREVWDELCRSSSPVECWSSHDDQVAVNMLFPVLIGALISRNEAVT